MSEKGAARVNIRRRLHQAIIGLYLCAVLGSVAMVAGPAYNDYLISRDSGRGIATVTSTSWLRTSVDYQDESGRVHSPKYGLLYPTGLGEGQQVWVRYSKRDVDIVKVEGRDWTLAVIPSLSVLVVSTLVAAAAWFAVGRAGGGPSISGGAENSPRVPAE